ncbi:hypothetical protein [Ectothiorhodospira shaposhnikovii]|uniref:hypothetical protein n=1 Tax=Ectothiorhodospira shaposhnikovii TaxID=1054 RepID=UPI001EE8372F|nr:hypothetical protein [Ectothiorhodospira shaposhnikovii]MCG5512797.1 hypothetical protein [Ectothiorhodospira shaposhnikovii]
MMKELNAYEELRYEINRKATETLMHLLLCYEHGKLSTEALSASIDTLFMAVSGLVDGDLFDMITATSEIFKSTNSNP